MLRSASGHVKRAALSVDDRARAAKLLSGITGKRLTYRRTGERANEQA